MSNGSELDLSTDGSSVSTVSTNGERGKEDEKDEKDDDEEFLISPHIKGSEKVLGGVSGILAALIAVVKRRV